MEKEFKGLISQLPYSFPLLLVSGINTIEDNNKITTWHNYKTTDLLVKSHLNGRYIAGILITEQICQSALLLLLNNYKDETLPNFYLGKTESNYLSVITPCQVKVIVEIMHQTSIYIIFRGTAWVKSKKVAIVKGGVKIEKK